jgi:hypothetical protein
MGRRSSSRLGSLSALCSIVFELGNLDILNQIYSKVERKLTPDSAVEIFQERMALGLHTTVEVDFILRCFSEIEFMTLEDREFEELYRLLAHNDLRIESENSLPQFIVSLINDKGPKYKQFLELLLLF